MMIKNLLKNRCYLFPTAQELQFWDRVDKLRQENWRNGYFVRLEERTRNHTGDKSLRVVHGDVPENRIGQAEFIPFGRAPMRH